MSSGQRKRKREEKEGPSELSRPETYHNVIAYREEHAAKCFSFPDSCISSEHLDAILHMTDRYQATLISHDYLFESDKEKKEFEKYENVIQEGIWGEPGWKEFQVELEEIHLRPGITYFLRETNGFSW